MSEKEIWLIFPGMGSQWAGMGRELISYPFFKNSISTSSKILEPFKIDIFRIINDENEKFEDPVETFVSIVAIEIALVDLLVETKVKASKFLGHSLGEIVCGYADGCLTHEEAILFAYWRGVAISSKVTEEGSMAAVGLSWEETTEKCKNFKNVFPACHNSLESVTISGDTEEIKMFVKEVKDENKFGKIIDTSKKAFHSPYVYSAAPFLLEKLKMVKENGKNFSDKWISSSIPLTSRDLNKRSCSAEYFINNMISPVLFCQGLNLIKPDSIIIEVAPNGIFKEIFKNLCNETNYIQLMSNEPLDGSIKTHLLNELKKLRDVGINYDFVERVFE